LPCLTSSQSGDCFADGGFDWYSERWGLPAVDQPIATVSAAMIAFVGAVAAFSYNGSIQRKAANRQNAEKAATLKAALKAEFASIAKMARDEIPVIQDFKAQLTFVPIQDFVAFSKASIGKIGLLSDVQAETIFQAYHIYRENIGYLQRKSVEQGLYTEDKNIQNIPLNLFDLDRKELENQIASIRDSAEDAVRSLKNAS
jgi:hypothetical protein